MVLLVALAVTALSCSPSRGASSNDAPRRIETPGVGDGTELRVVHEYGIVHRASVRDGHIETPLLWDGAWRIEGGADESTLRIGDSRYTTGVTGDPATLLLSCWTEGGTASVGEGPRPFVPLPDGARCTQTLLTRLAAEDGYAAAAAAIEEARRGLNDDSTLWSWYCGMAGEAAAAGAVLGGADGRTLIREAESFCDYSVLHGVGAMTAVLAGDAAVDALADVCAPDSASTLPEIARTSQCWHGGGMGLIRLSRLDIEEGGRLCMQAPAESSRLNCLEGLFSFMRTYRLRGDEVARLWPETDVDFATCGSISGDGSIAMTCYRSVAQSTVHGIAAAVSDSHDVRVRAVDVMRVACRAAPASRVGACWTGLGTLLALSLHPDIEERDEVGRWVAVCGDAPDTATSSQCYERVLLGLLRNDQLTVGLTADELVLLAPKELRDDLAQKLDYWTATIGGRSN